MTTANFEVHRTLALRAQELMFQLCFDKYLRKDARDHDLDMTRSTKIGSVQHRQSYLLTLHVKVLDSELRIDRGVVAGGEWPVLIFLDAERGTWSLARDM